MTTALTDFKAAFHRDPRRVHLNNAGQSPTCRPALDEMTKWTRRLYEEGAHVIFDFFPAVEAARVDLARFLGADPHELAYFQSPASAISQVALGLELKPGDEVITWDQEYPSNFYPWAVACERSGAKLVVAKSGEDLSTPLETLASLVTAKTKVIATSWVQYRSGAQMDLKALTEFAHARGIFVCADVIQGVGCLPFDFHASGLDAACGGSHKWTASFHGAGYLLLRKENVARLTPLAVGTMTYGSSDDFPKLNQPMKEGALRFEPGGRAFLEVLALSAATRFLSTTKMELIGAEAERLAKKLAAGLEALSYTLNSPHREGFRGAIVNFSPSGKSPLKTLEEVEARLKKAGVSHIRRAPGLRLAPHAHNTDEDIERTLISLQ